MAREELRKIRIQKEILWLKTLQEDVGNIIKKLEVITSGGRNKEN
jgi:hypothetical protein